MYMYMYMYVYLIKVLTYIVQRMIVKANLSWPWVLFIELYEF